VSIILSDRDSGHLSINIDLLPSECNWLNLPSYFCNSFVLSKLSQLRMPHIVLPVWPGPRNLSAYVGKIFWLLCLCRHLPIWMCFIVILIENTQLNLLV
jgi:hypothetical protein